MQHDGSRHTAAAVGVLTCWKQCHSQVPFAVPFAVHRRHTAPGTAWCSRVSCSQRPSSSLSVAPTFR